MSNKAFRMRKQLPMKEVINVVLCTMEKDFFKGVNKSKKDEKVEIMTPISGVGSYLKVKDGDECLCRRLVLKDWKRSLSGEAWINLQTMEIQNDLGGIWNGKWDDAKSCIASTYLGLIHDLQTAYPELMDKVLEYKFKSNFIHVRYGYSHGAYISFGRKKESYVFPNGEKAKLWSSKYEFTQNWWIEKIWLGDFLISASILAGGETGSGYLPIKDKTVFEVMEMSNGTRTHMESFLRFKRGQSVLKFIEEYASEQWEDMSETVLKDLRQAWTSPHTIHLEETSNSNYTYRLIHSISWRAKCKGIEVEEREVVVKTSWRTWLLDVCHYIA